MKVVSRILIVLLALVLVVAGVFTGRLFHADPDGFFHPESYFL